MKMATEDDILSLWSGLGYYEGLPSYTKQKKRYS